VNEGDRGDEFDWLLEPTEPVDQSAGTPVTVLTGFLGAGKTTVVNRILSEAHGMRLGVIVNDFGAISVDSELIIGVDAGTVSLANGCVCCEIRGDLVAAVNSVLDQDHELDGLVLEASGVADPASIARTFTSTVFRTAVRLDDIVAVVDAEQLPTQAADPTIRDLVFGQIGYSDLVLLNKIDLADRGRVDDVRRFVLDRLPTVRIIEATRGQVPLDILLGGRPTDTVPPVVVDADHNHHDASGAFATWTYSRDEAMDVDALLAAVSRLPRSVYRIKGFAHHHDDPEHRYLIQAVGGRAEAHRFDGWSHRTRRTDLVIIAARHDTDHAQIDDVLDGCIAQPR
jgi:G3E family GTPase